MFPHTPASVGPQLKVCGGGVNDAFVSKARSWEEKLHIEQKKVKTN